MKLFIESTDQIVSIDGVECRQWKGTHEDGSECLVFVHRIAVSPVEPLASVCESELEEMGVPRRLMGLSPIVHHFPQQSFIGD